MVLWTVRGSVASDSGRDQLPPAHEGSTTLQGDNRSGVLPPHRDVPRRIAAAPIEDVHAAMEGDEAAAASQWPGGLPHEQHAVLEHGSLDRVSLHGGR